MSVTNINIPVVNEVNYGTKSLRSFGPKIWNSVPHHLKSYHIILSIEFMTDKSKENVLRK